LWRRRFARSAGIWALLAVAASAFYVGFVSPNSQASVSETLSTFSQCWVNRYDCSDFATQAEAQEVFWACGGRQNDVHRLDADRDGWACEMLP
jgi:Excalibur calcium-binding domain